MRALVSIVGVSLAAAACGGQGAARPEATPIPPVIAAARLPRVPGEYAPSLVAIDEGSESAGGGDPTGSAGGAGGGAPRGIDRAVAHDPSDVSDGGMLSDVDSCATCHPDAAAQWSTSAHSFASFGNPIYRVNVEQQRTLLGKPASQHCGGCHDMPLMIDGLMTAASDVPAADLRAHSGVTCRLWNWRQARRTQLGEQS